MYPVFAGEFFTTSTTFGFNQFQTKVLQLKNLQLVLCIYMESRKMVLKDLFTGQQWRIDLCIWGEGRRG